MEIEDEIALRQQHALDVVGDLRGWAAIGIAREAAVEVALVERRGAHSGHRRREVRRRQDDDPAADLGGLEAADELAERDLALVLVAVVARHQQDSRALAVLDGSDWDRNPAISRPVNRIRQPDKTVLLAVPLEIDFGLKAALTASHRAFLCAKQDRGYSTKASLVTRRQRSCGRRLRGQLDTRVAIN